MDKCMDREMNGWTDQCMPRFPLYPNRDHLQKPLSLNALHNLPSAWLSLPLKKFKIAPNSLTHFSIGLSIRKSLRSFNFSKPIKKLCLSNTNTYRFLDLLHVFFMHREDPNQNIWAYGFSNQLSKIYSLVFYKILITSLTCIKRVHEADKGLNKSE